MKHGVRLFSAIAVTLGAVSACAMDASDGATTNGAGPGPQSSAGTSSSGNFGGSGGSGGTAQPPEVELDQGFRVPVVSGHWVWTANPLSGRVALIDAKSFKVRTALAGAGPTYLTALPPGDAASRALVINVDSQDASLFSADEAGELTPGVTLPVHQDANAWAVTPDGAYAIAWTDAAGIANADPSAGFQDITVLSLADATPSSKRLSVGYRPSRIFMGDDARHAYVVTEAGVDVVDLKADSGATVEREVELSLDPANDTAKREVNVTQNGDWAFVRRDGADFVTVVDLAKSTLVDVKLPGPVTDLDLSADDATAVAIVRQANPAGLPVAGVAGGGSGGDTGETAGGASAGGESAGGNAELAGNGGLGGAMETGGTGPGPTTPGPSIAVLLPVATIFSAPKVFDSVPIDEVFGSVDLGPKGTTALLYSNATPNQHLTLLTLASQQFRTLDLKLPVFSAVSTPDGAHAIALLQPPAGSKQPGAFAVVPVTKNLPPRIQGTSAATVPSDPTLQPAMVALDDKRALVTVSDGQSNNVAYLARMPELTTEPIPLDSVPLPRASGLVPEANQAFVAQKHAEGRITFIDLDSGEVHTLTGFELSDAGGYK